MRLGSKNFFTISLLVLVSSLFMSGCVRVQNIDPQSGQVEYFRPPTLVPTPLPPTPTLSITAQSNQSGGCSNSLSFISDATIPDGTVVTAGSSMDKRWEVKNSGTCNWEEGYTLRLISGPEMGVNPVQALIPARSGSQMVIRIVFTAPAETGAHISAWQAYDRQGNPFGDSFYINIQVEPVAAEGTSTPD